MGYAINYRHLGIHLVYNARRGREPFRANVIEPIYPDKTVCLDKFIPVLFNREMA